MAGSSIEVTDVFRLHGAYWRQTQQGHLNLNQLKVMSAIERCRSAQLGGHKLHCQHCDTDVIAYNSCRNRHCPKCQAFAAKRWLDARQTQLLPMEYYHVVFTLPAAISQEHWQACKTSYFLPVKVLSRLFRRVFVEGLHQLFTDGSLLFYGELSGLSTPASFETWCAEQQNREWVVYAKRPFAGPEAVLTYLSLHASGGHREQSTVRP
jgi:hypothetical protein